MIARKNSLISLTGLMLYLHAACHPSKRLTLSTWLKFASLIKLLLLLEMVQMTLQWYCKHTLELASLEKRASKLQGVLITQSVNLNSSGLCCFTMVAKHTDVIPTWFCILSTRTSFMFAPNSILVSTLHSQGRHCTSNLCIRCTTSQWLLCQLCGTLVSTLRRKEKDEEDTV